MKKLLKSLVLVFMVCLLAGCNSEEKVKVCTSNTKDTTNGYEVSSNYEIHYKGDVVKYVVTEEIVTSDNEDILDYFETTLTETYAQTNETYGGYENTVTKESNKVISKTKIDYTKMDLDQFVSDNSVMKSYVNSKNEITLDGAVSLYKDLGAECK